MWAPADHIDQTHQMAVEAAERRAAQRQRSVQRRQADEADYRADLADAIFAYLDFADEHAELARKIADDAAATASVVGSGGVGRTRTLNLDERARLAARAHLRHRHTDYDDRLFDAQLEAETVELDDTAYRRIREEAHTAVDEFIDRHRS